MTCEILGPNDRGFSLRQGRKHRPDPPVASRQSFPANTGCPGEYRAIMSVFLRRLATAYVAVARAILHPWLLSNGTGAVELYAGETIIQIQSKWVNEVGNVRSKWNYVFGYAYQIPAGKTLASITLPNQSYSYRVGILGMAML